MLFPMLYGRSQTGVEFGEYWGVPRLFAKIAHAKNFLNQYCKGKLGVLHNQHTNFWGDEEPAFEIRPAPNTSRPREAYEIVPVTLQLGEPI